jgi:hypothetical protein
MIKIIFLGILAGLGSIFSNYLFISIFIAILPKLKILTNLFPNQKQMIGTVIGMIGGLVVLLSIGFTWNFFIRIFPSYFLELFPAFLPKTPGGLSRDDMQDVWFDCVMLCQICFFGRYLIAEIAKKHPGESWKKSK